METNPPPTAPLATPLLNPASPTAQPPKADSKKKYSRYQKLERMWRKLAFIVMPLVLIVNLLINIGET